MVLHAGDKLGPYEIKRQLGTGGMATVYEGYHAQLDRRVAIKVMHQNLLADDQFRQRFQREAQIVARLEHPNIVPIYDYSEVNGQPYLVMKQIEGRTLKQMLKEGALPLDEIRRIMQSVAGALDYAHRNGVLHRDIKPSNIIVAQDGTPYLTDFGLARLAQSGESTMSADMMIGTPYYISPEQATGEREIDARADVYSLGVVLYELLAGRVPFLAETPYATIHEHINTAPPPLSAFNPDIPPAVEDVLRKALAKKPADRYATAGQMIQAFEEALAQTGLHNLDDSRVQFDPERIAPPRPKRPPTDSEQRAAFSTGLEGTSFAESMSRFGEELGRKAEEWAHKAEEWARKVETAADEGRLNWKPGMKWAELPDGRWGFYTPEELSAVRRGQPLPQETEEAIIRRRIERELAKKQEKRNGLIMHSVIFLVVNLSIWTSWLVNNIGDGQFGFPWPLMVTFFWGIGLFSDFSEYHNRFGRGREKREAEIERELDRELAKRGISREKRKVEDLFEDESRHKPKNDYYIDDHGQRIRLNDEGELTDSYVDEMEKRRRRRR